VSYWLKCLIGSLGSPGSPGSPDSPGLLTICCTSTMRFGGDECPFCSCLLRPVVRQRHFTRCGRAEEWHPCPSCPEKIRVRGFGLHQASCGKIATKNHGHCSAPSASASRHPVLNRTTEHPSEQIPWTDGQGNTSINTMTHGDAIIQLQHKYTALRSDFMLLVEKLHEFGAVLLSCRPMPSDLSLHRSAIPESRNAPITVEPQTFPLILASRFRITAILFHLASTLHCLRNPLMLVCSPITRCFKIKVIRA
jgi:hypothetical protein